MLASARRAASATARRVLEEKFHVPVGSALVERAHTRGYRETFFAKDLTVELALKPSPRPYLGPAIPFGKIFSEHFLVVDWNADGGWGAPRIRPVAPIPLHPAAQTLQYGAHCFEGMKAYRSHANDTPHLFRPGLNMERLRRSAERLYLPTFAPEQLLACIKILVNIEQSWVPKEPDCALYLRPTLAATTPFLGVGPADQCVLYVLCSPCGPFLPPDHSGPVRMFLEESVVRAAPGGVGQYKVGGNYAPTIAPQMAARRAHGCAQVLYTIALPNGDRAVSEAGAMNMFFVFKRGEGQKPELATPPLDGTILPGVTRQSVLDLARGDWEVSERPVTVAELVAASAEGRLLEAFATGTAAVILPIESFVRASGDQIATEWGRHEVEEAGAVVAPELHVVSEARAEEIGARERGGPVAVRMVRPCPDDFPSGEASTLKKIQFGEIKHEWSVSVV